MSAKTNRRVRQQLSGHRFPALTEHEVEINHNRRIIALAKSERIQLQKAVERYVRKVGFMPKPKAL